MAFLVHTSCQKTPKGARPKVCLFPNEVAEVAEVIVVVGEVVVAVAVVVVVVEVVLQADFSQEELLQELFRFGR